MRIKIIIGAILFVFVIIQLVTYPYESPQKISKIDFEKLIFSKDIDHINIYNKDAFIYLKAGKLSKHRSIIKKDISKIPENGPHFSLEILDALSFSDSVHYIQNKFAQNEIIYISNRVVRNYLIEAIPFISLFLIFLVSFIIWLLFLINILKSEFNDTTNKLIWILIITFIPIIGLFLYQFIGKKQRKQL